MPDSVDIDRYFSRIGYTGPRSATLETLAAIHLRHPQAIPFENLDTLLKRPVSLDIDALEHKMLRGGRGGWCFEQNLLLRDVLQALGFRVTGLAARAMWNAPPGVIRPRTHMLLRIDLSGAERYIADVGFGGLTLTAPLRLVTDVEQTTPHETFRLVGADANFVLEARVGQSWKALYSFDEQPQLLPDYAVSNWYLANHPESPFINNLMVARVTPECRYGLFNNNLSTHHLHGGSEHATLTSPAELRHILESTFGIELPDDAGMDTTLARIIR